MYIPKMTDLGLCFGELIPRDETDMIVIHHTGNPTDDDLSAEEIHESHLERGWSGIGYHFVVRKNGEIEVGRPMDAWGAHAEGDNDHTIGIVVCGNFEIAEPTVEQIESTSVLVAWLCERYNIAPITKDTVVGHRDLMPTACPGQNLYDLLQEIRGKAIWYQQQYPQSKGYMPE